MSVLSQKGFSFSFDSNKCSECKGKCCYGSKPTFLWISNEELTTIASFLKLDSELFKRDYTITFDKRINLKDIKINGIYTCIFFDLEEKNCSIYDVRPKQCRDFPFWDEFRRNYKIVVNECPGVIITS